MVDSYIFTDFQSNNELGASVAKEYQHAAKLRGCDFLSVTLVCDLEENERRIQSIGRRALVIGGSHKLLDQEILKEMRERGSLFRFDGSVKQIDIDVGTRPAEDSAQVIAASLSSMGYKPGNEAR